jgi:hypothetical protein
MLTCGRDAKNSILQDGSGQNPIEDFLDHLPVKTPKRAIKIAEERKKDYFRRKRT